MLGLANQSLCVAASELARRRLPDCFIRYAHDPVYRKDCSGAKIPHSAINHDGTQNSGAPELAV
jgi:hypothetical protein